MIFFDPVLFKTVVYFIIFGVQWLSKTLNYQFMKVGGPKIKGNPDLNHLIFEINVRKSRVRDRTTLISNDAIFNGLWVDQEIQVQSRSMSDSSLSDIDFKKMVWV